MAKHALFVRLLTFLWSQIAQLQGIGCQGITCDKRCLRSLLGVGCAKKVAPQARVADCLCGLMIRRCKAQSSASAQFFYYSERLLLVCYEYGLWALRAMTGDKLAFGIGCPLYAEA